MSYRILIVNHDYHHFTDQMYCNNQRLARASFAEQHDARMKTFFGVNDFYSSNLRKLGHEAIDIICNNRFMQYAWAVENGLMASKADHCEGFIRSLPKEWLADVFQAQVIKFKPDVIVNLGMASVTSDTLKKIKPGVPLIIGQHASPITPSMQDLSAYDLIVSSLPNLVEYFRDQGKQSTYFRLGFETEILKNIAPVKEKSVDLAFVGGFSTHHLGGAKLFDYLAEQGFSMALYGYGQESLSRKAASFFRGPLFDLSMYELYMSSKIVINRHIDVSGEYANNMRLYEGTGAGALMLTEAKKNLYTLFSPGTEVVAYNSIEECAELARYYLSHDKERSQIALNGQQRTLSEHTYYHRMVRLVDIVDNYLMRNEMSQSKSTINLSKTSDFKKTIDSDGCREDLGTKLKRKEINKKGWNDYAKNWDNNKEMSKIPGLAAEDHGQARYLGDEWNLMCKEIKHPYGVDIYSNEEFQNYIETNLLRPFLPEKNDLNIMEIGPGGGRVTQLLATRCQNLYAVDICEEMLKQLQKKFVSDSRIKYILTDGKVIPGIPPNSLDCVITFDACVHMEPYEIFRYLELSKELLKEGGIGVIHFSDVETDIGFKKFKDEYGAMLANGPEFYNFSIMSKSIMAKFIKELGIKPTEEEKLKISKKELPAEDMELVILEL